MSSSCVSKIQCYEGCHYKYRLLYIDNVKQLDNPVFERGKILHFILENIKYFDIVRGFFDSDIGKVYYPLICSGDKEKRIGLKLYDGKLTCCDFNDPACLIRGIIDVLNANAIVDYKSGKYVEYSNQSWLQLEFYALWLFLNSDYDEINVSYVYIEHNKVNSRIIKRTEMNDIIRKILTRISDIIKFEKSPDESHNITKLCDYCGARNSCKFYKASRECVDVVDLEI